jgi:putative aminopeptidase FrvX
MGSFDFDESLLVELTETHGVPGYESAVRDVVRREFSGAVDEIRSDAMGNLVGTIEGRERPAYEVVVAAHMDEIGFMVRHVDDDGFLQLDALGGWDPQVLRAQRVVVHGDSDDVGTGDEVDTGDDDGIGDDVGTGDGEDGTGDGAADTLTGVIGSIPPHAGGSEDDDDREVHDVDVDLGLPADVVREKVSIGDRVSTTQSTEILGEHVNGKAIDNRVSVFALCELADRLEDPGVTVHLAATVQEEVGLRGAEAIGVNLAPDLALALDTTVANDVPGTEDDDAVTELGVGAAIKFKDSSVLPNRKVVERLRAVADANDVPYQHEVLPAGGTDTGGLQRAAGATPVGAVSFPTRYLHTPTESVHGDDVAAGIELARRFLETETGDHDYTL